MKLKEFWNENKTAITHCSIFLIGFAVSTAFILTICNRRIDRANTEIAITRTELQRARTEVERAGNTISEIRRIQSELTAGIGDNNTELHTTIERLELIRDKVSDIESELDRYSNNSSVDIDVHDN